MKKIFLLFLFLFSLISLNSVEVVFDPVLAAEAAAHTAKFLQQIQQQATLIKNQTLQLQATMDSMKNFDPKNATDVLLLINNTAKDLKDTNRMFRSLHLTFNNKSYALEDVIPSNEDIEEYFKRLLLARKNNNDFEEERIAEEIYNIKSNNFDYLTNLAQDTITFSDTTDKHIDNINDNLENIVRGFRNESSLTTQLQSANAIATNTNTLLQRIAKLLSMSNKIAAAEAAIKNLEDKSSNVSINSSEEHRTIDTSLSSDFQEHLRNVSNSGMDATQIFK